MSKLFPKYASAADAKCFSCGKKLMNVRESCYHTGHWQGTCVCGYDTWFDTSVTVTHPDDEKHDKKSA